MRVYQRLAAVAALTAAAACGGSSTDPGTPPPVGGTAEWTVMVYMAADNSLAADGIFDIDEMEDAGFNSNVNVVVQAEFSPDVLGQYQCDASCFNRPNFNTFRYAPKVAHSTRTGPDGSATDIGNVDMTDPNQLKAFIAWAEQNYPARHYLLVLWNHGGGYTGLIQDETSAGSGLMTLAELKTGLSGGGQLDVTDFDMCLMAGYETLAKLVGLTDYAVFSEEVVPGEGNPYTAILNALQASPTMTPAQVSSMIVGQFHGYYQGKNDKSSTTLSAYDLAGFANFEQAMSQFANAMTTALPTEGAHIAQAAAATQKYTVSELTDVVNFLDTLNAHVTDAPLKASIAGLRDQATSASFRIATQRRNGAGSGQQPAADVSRSSGLHLVMPSGSGNDVFNASGPRSLAAYQALFPGRPWTQFLTAWVNGQAQIPASVTDQGDATRLETYLVWDQGAIAADADVDLWVLEPDGNIYIPAFGSVTPNGSLSNDSYGDGVSFEGYLTNRIIQKGTYKFYANLWRDPGDFQPLYDLAYRQDQNGNFTLLYGTGNQPTLSLATSWLADPTPTLGEVEASAYTDLQYVAFSTFPSPPAAQGLRRGQGGPGVASLVSPDTHEITPAQVRTIRRLMAERRGGKGAARTPGQPMPFGEGVTP